MKAIKNLCLFCFLILEYLCNLKYFKISFGTFLQHILRHHAIEVASEDMSQFLKDVSRNCNGE